MPAIPEDLHYSKDHEWVRVVDDVATIGITDYAQKSLGDIVYVDLPRVGESFEANEMFGTVDSVKASSEIFTPVSGEVIEVNELFSDDDNTKLLNSEPYGDGWLIRIRMNNPSQVDRLLTPAEYEDFTSKDEKSE